jgi:fructoselysine-6-P-deglycase FrlB-like protein
MELKQLVDQARQSTLFTAPVLGPDLERFLKEKGDFIKNLAREAIEKKVKHIYWVGCGNSWVNLFSGKYLMDKFTDIPSDVFISYDFIWRNPKLLNKDSWVFLASFSGATEDTAGALRFAKAHNARTITLVNKADSYMGKEADVVIDYNSKALYILPLAAAYLFALELAKLQGCKEAQPVIDDLYKLPALLSKQYIDEEEKARRNAEQFLDEHLLYTLCSGPLWGIGYKFGLTVFMENMRVHGSFMDATEFRHGPAEMLDREKATAVLLMGTDESRPMLERVREILGSYKAKLLVFDAADYPGIHPLLSPFVLMIPLQWFAVYSSLMRGITDLDERVLMGRGIMGKGKDITWP